MKIFEFLRRIALLLGVGCFLWLWFAGPPVLLEVSRADFAAQYERQYGKRQYGLMGVMELGDKLIREQTNPGSLEAFTARQTQHKLLTAGDSNWAVFYRSLPAQAAFYGIDQPPFAAIRPQIQTLFLRSQMAVMYIPVVDGSRTAHIEIHYRNRPRETKAPTQLLYPYRLRAWLWLAGALLVYFLLPGMRRSGGSAAYSRIAPLALDAMGLLFAAFFFGLSLYVVNSTDEVFGSEFGMSLFLWAVGCAGLILVMWAAKIASYRIMASSSAICVDTLWRRREIPFSEMSEIGYLVRGDIRIGIFVRSRDGRTIKLDWAGLLGFDAVLAAINSAQVRRAEDAPA